MMQNMEAIVMTCLAEECSFNCSEECCAPAIEVGDDHPRCDTYTTDEVTVAEKASNVQDCKVMDCHFNSSMDCTAAGVTLGMHADHADCMTYRH